MTLTELFTAIANSIRAKTGGTAKIDAENFPSAIDGIVTGITPTGTKTITTNGTHDVTNYASAKVNVPIPSGYVNPSGTKSITSNGTHDVETYESVNVNVPVSSGRIGNGVSPASSDTNSATFNVNTENLIGFYLSSPEINFRTYDFDSYPANVILGGFYQNGTFNALYTSVNNDSGDAGNGVSEATINCSVSNGQVTINGCIGDNNPKLYPIYGA